MITMTFERAYLGAEADPDERYGEWTFHDTNELCEFIREEEERLGDGFAIVRNARYEISLLRYLRQ